MIPNLWGVFTEYTHAKNFRIILFNSFTLFSLVSILWAITFFMYTYNLLLHNFQSFFWCLHSFVLLLAISVVCAMTVGECAQSPIMVQKILVRKGLRQDVIDKLEKLFVQLNAMKIEFTACGMFNIDLSYLSWILGANVTYILLIAQFK